MQNGNDLFPGSRERFRFRLKTILSEDDATTMLNVLGLESDEIGTHSIRKGCLSYYTSGGSTARTSIRIRAGWSSKGVEHLYIRYEGAGDQYVGRVACSLDIHETTFSVLPPRFNLQAEEDLQFVQESVKKVFNGITIKLLSTGTMFLASMTKRLYF